MRETLFYKLRKPQRVLGVEDDRADIEDINFNSDQIDSVLHTQASRIGTIEGGLDTLNGKIDAEAIARANGDAQNAQAIRDETSRAQLVESEKLGRTETATDSSLLGGQPPSAYATAEQGSKADTALQTETDPTVPSWAKQPTKPAYAAQEVGAATPDEVAAAVETSKAYTDVKLTYYLTEEETYQAIDEKVAAGVGDFPDMSDYETVTGATEKMVSAVASAAAYTDTEIANNPGPPGRDGVAGTAATVTVGSVTTGSAGTAASVSNVGTQNAAVLNFVIPKGDTGAAGAAASIPAGMMMRCKGKSIPAGWVLCNGKNGTINMTQSFVVYETVSGSARTPYYGVVYVQKT